MSLFLTVNIYHIDPPGSALNAGHEPFLVAAVRTRHYLVKGCLVNDVTVPRTAKDSDWCAAEADAPLGFGPPRLLIVTLSGDSSTSQPVLSQGS
jgi:hypothetical protein